jgi:hypothetical protein
MPAKIALETVHSCIHTLCTWMIWGLSLRISCPQVLHKNDEILPKQGTQNALSPLITYFKPPSWQEHELQTKWCMCQTCPSASVHSWLKIN